MILGQRPITLIRKAPGTYLKGRYVEGVELAPVTIYGSCQHETEAHRQKRIASSENEHLETGMMIYTESEIKPGGEGTDQPDILIIDGARYEVSEVAPWRCGILNHYEVLAFRQVP